MTTSCVHIYCGDGKGKTTSALGFCIRAAGAGKKVLIYQFMKDNSSSEINSLDLIPNIIRIPSEEKTKFSFLMTKEELAAAKVRNNEKFLSIVDMIDNIDVLLLDEAIYAIAENVLDEALVVDFINNRPNQLEVILTGQHPSKELMSLADYISDIKKLKHPFDKGLSYRKGIES